MSYKSKRVLTTMITGALLAIGYLIYAVGRSGPAAAEPGALRSWAVAMLGFVGVTVVVLVVVQILFHVVLAARLSVTDGEAAERVMTSSLLPDEMDRTIRLRSGQLGYLVVGLGFIAALAAAALGASAVVVLHVVLGAFVVGSLAGGVVTVYRLEWGLGHG
ncbi:hypothetical protein [Microlunatus sp. GCM10028923]|uniref:hypothetical protein n=1 Tax=Microlunatus sp. GCM10028923 TaxID=3273400 RepID=UPI00360CE3DF